MRRDRHPRSPRLDPRDLVGKTAREIDAYAKAVGLVPRGPDPVAGLGSYTDRATGEQRILIHPDYGHFHVNTAAGERLAVDGRIIAPEEPDAHLPLGKPMRSTP